MTTPITVAYGDGIGPEIMEAVLLILKEAKANISIDTINIGEQLYNKGYDSGISPEAFDMVRRNKVLLKAPITTPQGKGYKSLNVTFRKALGLFANVRPSVSYYPFVQGGAKQMDMVTVRENEEDLYSGVEYRCSANTNLSFKLITRPGCEKIIRYAFEYARINNRKKVTCVTKDNIMKIADGTFHSIFNDIAKECPNIEADHFIVDIGAARIATNPEHFDVVVTLNLYGDILSDIAADVSGSVGLAGSSNIGDKYAMFEAIHGSAPDIAGKQIANPSGLLNGAILMLEYIGQGNVAADIQNAWLKTLEDGMHTADIYNEEVSKEKLSTLDFAKAVISNLGEKPGTLPAIGEKKSEKINIKEPELLEQEEKLIGVDIYINDTSNDTDKLVSDFEHIDDKFELQHIAQRGIKIWPNIEVDNIKTDLFRLRYISNDDSVELTGGDILTLQQKVLDKGYVIGLTHNLNVFNGMAGFTKAQGE